MNKLKIFFGKDAQADWRKILVIVAVLILFTLVLDAWVFMDMKRGEAALQDDGTLITKRFDLGELRHATLYYEGKAEEFEKIGAGGTVEVADPSL